MLAFFLFAFVFFLSRKIELATEVVSSNHSSGKMKIPCEKDLTIGSNH
jgi:hypothetical protein